MNKILKILKSRWLIYGSLASAVFFVFIFPNSAKRCVRKIISLTRNRTVYSVVKSYKENVGLRLKPYYKNDSINYPGEKLIFLVNKDKLELKLYAGTSFKAMHLIKTYSILANSGLPGPKLREGDYQIPEGIYRVESLNPNSSYHLSLKLNYPNKFDREMAEHDKRSNIGSNIFIHGKNVSIGCIAVGDASIEELFVLTHLVGKDDIKVVIVPNYFKDKVKINSILKRSPEWTAKLYNNLRQELIRLQLTRLDEVSLSK